MKDLSEFNKVVEALSKVASEASTSTSMELLCYYWDYETLPDKKRNDLETAIAKLVLTGADPILIQKERAKLDALEKPQVMMCFRLVTPIPMLKGTKIIYDINEKARQPVMTNVQHIYISEQSIKLKLVKYDETGEMARDSMGKETPIIKMHVVKGLLDVKEAIYDRNNKMVRSSRAIITPISFRTMQVAGKILRGEETVKRKLYGFGDE